MKASKQHEEVGGDLEAADAPLLDEGHAKVHAEQQERVLGLRRVIVAGGTWCLVTTAMVFLNKAAVSSFRFGSPNAILLLQCAISVALSGAGHLAGAFQLEPLNRRLVRMWLPVNLIFVGMLTTSFYSVKALNVAMATIMKNLTNLFVLAGDKYFYRRTYSWGVWGSMALMMVSAVAAGATDLTFDARGYIWALANCCFTAGYSLYLRGAMDRVKEVTQSGQKLNEVSMVYINNLLSLPLVLAVMGSQGELSSVWGEPDLRNPAFLVVVGMSGVLAFALSFAMMWFLGSTTPTTFSLVGSLNKVPQALLGLFAFATPWTLQNLASIGLGLAAGVMFAAAKARER